MFLFDIPNLNIPQPRIRVLVQVDVDGKVSVHVSHLVLEALGHADDEVVDECADGAEGSDIFAAPVVELDVYEVLLGVGEADVQVAEVLDELAARAFDGHYAGLDVDFDCCAGWVSIVRFLLSPTAIARTAVRIFVDLPPSGI